MMSPYPFNDYKAYLKALIHEHKSERAYRTRLAQAAGCQRSYFSQVLHAHAHLTPDHAYGLCGLIGLGPNERDYFLTLVDLSRAATKSLRALLEQKLSQLKTKDEDLSQRYQRPALAPGVIEAQYYSSWHFAAIHILTTIPAFRTVDTISRRLSLPVAQVKATLSSLEGMGLVRAQGTHWMPTLQDLHLPNQAIVTSVNHGNWRQYAVLNAQMGSPQNLHYTAVHSLSRALFDTLKRDLLQTLDKSRQLVQDSKEEELACLTVDWFVV